MAKHLIRACWGGGQLRINIPKLVVRELKWLGVSHFVLVENEDKTLTIRRFVDGDSLKGDGKRDRAGPDR